MAAFACMGSVFSRQQCGEGCTHDHDHGEKRKRESEEGNATTTAKKPKETIRVSATRHDSQVRYGHEYWAFPFRVLPFLPVLSRSHAYLMYIL